LKGKNDTMVLRTSSSATPPSSNLLQSPLIAVLRAQHARDYYPVVEILVGAGIRSIELTLSTPKTLEHISELRQLVPSTVDVGVGTITDLEQAELALKAGAEFLVTPTTNLEIIALACRRGIPIYPGGLTPTELHSAWTAGATAVKVFPASTVGVNYLSLLRGPFPDIQVIPSGGVALTDVQPWLEAGALAVSLGGPLIGNAFSGGSLTELADRAGHAVYLTSGFRSQS
jgi:2-dehydro-3-deoxyphosphogluconate aldolase/(4S)-4-hydroxy-2-oxoglutarate aldolase